MTTSDKHKHKHLLLQPGGVLLLIPLHLGLVLRSIFGGALKFCRHVVFHQLQRRLQHVVCLFWLTVEGVQGMGWAWQLWVVLGVTVTATP